MASTPKSVYWRGMRDGAAFIPMMIPFAMLFGVVATEAGLTVLETLFFSVMVVAGAAQFTALQLMTENAPTIVVLASALAVNLRLAMYSAALTPYVGAAPLLQRLGLSYLIVDNTYACAVIAYEDNPQWTLRLRMIYFAGVSTHVCPIWFGMTVLGAWIGSAIPPEYALDFAMPIVFLSLIAPMLRTSAHVVAAFVSVVLALVFAFLPYNLGLFIAGIAAMMTGAHLEVRNARKSEEDVA